MVSHTLLKGSGRSWSLSHPLPAAPPPWAPRGPPPRFHFEPTCVCRVS